MKKILLILMVFCLGGCGVMVKRYNPLPPDIKIKKIYVEEPKVYERFTLWWAGPDKVTEEILGERRWGSEDADAKKAIEAARSFKENLKKMLNKKFIIVENLEDPDCVIIKICISYKNPVYRGHLSRNAYFRGYVVIFLELECRGVKIARLLAECDYTDENTWRPMPLQKKLILALDYFVPKIEEVLGDMAEFSAFLLLFH